MSDVTSPHTRLPANAIAPPPLSADDTVQMDLLGIRYVAGNFLYRQYRYQVLADAVHYAELERGKIDYQAEVNVQPAWVPAPEPAEGDWRLMQELGITFDGRQYRLLDYRYDRFEDAINQARLMRTERFGEDRPPNA